MRSAQCIRLLAILFLVRWALLFASSAALLIYESEMSAVISEEEIPSLGAKLNRQHLPGRHYPFAEPTGRCHSG